MPVSTTAWQQHKYPLLGLTYLVVVALLISLSIAAFRKDLPWQRTATIEVVTTHAGLELNNHADVKIQGRVVGEVRGTRTDNGQTVIELGIEHDELRHIPADVDAAIVPKTLFGEKYVDLLPRKRSTATRIADGATIRQTRTATEIGDVYAKLVPLLRAVEPARLSTVLNTLATTLEGRGTQLARTIDNLGLLLAELDPHLDTLDADLRALATTLEGYDAAAPDLLTTLANTTALTNDLLMPSRVRLGDLFSSVTDLSSTTREVLAENGDDLVRIVVRSEPLLALLDEYAPMMACSIEGLRLVDLHGNLTTGSRGPYVLLTIDMFINRQPYSAPDDLPGNPSSDAHLDRLPAPIRSWEPHCPEFGAQIHEAVDAEPRTLAPMPGQAVSEENASLGAKKATTTPRTPEAQRIALATALARDLLDQLDGDEATDADLGGLLIAPLLGGEPVEVS